MKAKHWILCSLFFVVFCLPVVGTAQTRVGGIVRKKAVSATQMKKEEARLLYEKSITEGMPIFFEKNEGQYDPQVIFASAGYSNIVYLTPDEAVLSLYKRSRKEEPEKKPPVDLAQPIIDKHDLAKAPVSAQQTGGQDNEDPLEGVRGIWASAKRSMFRSPAANLPGEKGVSGDAAQGGEQAGKDERPRVVKMQISGNKLPNVNIEGLEEQEGKSNYFIGSDSSKWRTNVKNFGRVKYNSVYTGIDMVFYGDRQSRLEFDFIVNPGADAKQIKLHFEGPDKIEIDRQGNLVMEIDGISVTQHKPHVYQVIAGKEKTVGGQYLLLGEGDIGFDVGKYNRTKPLILDPVLEYSTYLGGDNDDTISGLAVDQNGNAYVAGRTLYPFSFPGMTFVPPGPNQPTAAAIIAKLNPTGKKLLYSTFITGTTLNSYTGAAAIAVDNSGNAYITGGTSATDFPVTAGVAQSTNRGDYDAFLAKLNPTGSSLIFSTFLGGTDSDGGVDIAIDGIGNSYIVGSTRSTDFNTYNPKQGNLLGGEDSFVAKLNAMGGLIYSTYLGGASRFCNPALASRTMGWSIAADGAGNAYVAGMTNAIGFPIKNALQGTPSGCSDGFLTKISPQGDDYTYSTFIGGDDTEEFHAVTLDSEGDVYLAGITSSSNFPTTTGALYPAPLGGFVDGVVVKLDDKGTTADLVYSTYFGGSNMDIINSIAVDTNKNMYIAGETQSEDFPMANALIPNTTPGGKWASGFVSVIDRTGAPLRFSTYFVAPGFSYDVVSAVAVDNKHDVYIAGVTTSYANRIPTKHAFQPFPGLPADGFIAKLGETSVYLR